MDFICKVPICNLKFHTSKHLLSHLKQHIKDDYSIECPYTECTNVCKVVSSFSAHLSREHVSSVHDDEIANVSNPTFNQIMQCHETGNIEYNNTITLEDVTSDSEDHDANVAGFLGLQQQHALFFMKLQCQF